MEYNTVREHLIIPEYGRNIQKMVNLAIEIEDREERNKAAKTIIKIMGQLNPSLRDVNEFNHKLWDHLHIIADFKLDVDSPFPLPEKEALEARPEMLSYNDERIPFKHYGKIIPKYIKSAIEMEDGDEKNALILSIANMMKKSYVTWNKESVIDEEIINDLDRLSKGQLQLDLSTELIKSTEIITKPRNKSKNTKNKKKKR
ncbi:DUF4290 domain-containing protein [bacterium SCSIO 12741]|nr:DUF4290 domain-containing protein [bacterium SCSIO 12741]